MALRSTKVGIAYEVEKKNEENLDRECQQGTLTHIANWINGILEGEDGIAKCPPGDDWKPMMEYLRNGVVLCKLVNKLIKHTGGKPIKFQTKCNSPFVAMTNIENFNKGCQDYGLPEESTFQTGDLWEARKCGFYAVINTIHCLAFLANSKQVLPAYVGEISKTIDRE